MIFATKVITAEQLAEATSRGELLNAEIDRMARERYRVERDQVAQQKGRLVPQRSDTYGERVYGDIILVMVDTGDGVGVVSDIVDKLD